MISQEMVQTLPVSHTIRIQLRRIFQLIFKITIEQRQALYDIIYGAEYQYTYKNIAVDDDVPCAICSVAHASSVIMIPAKMTCPTGWSKEYAGVLTASAQWSSHRIGEYLCVDQNAEYLGEGTRQQNYDGNLFYPVQAACGSLPCPPFTSSQLIACVVCSK